MTTIDPSPSRRAPAVSIGVPVYNGARYLREALDSILAQTFADFEVILSDNASVDATGEICREYAVRDGRVRYIRQSSNIGGLANFRFVLDQARAEYFSWVAHDDVLLPEFLECSVAFLRGNPSLVAVSGDFAVLDENSRPAGTKTLELIRSEIPWCVRASEFYRYPISNAFFVIYGLVRKDALETALAGSRTGPLIAGSELPLLARLAARGQIASVARVLRKYRYHPQSAFHKEMAALAQRPIRGRLRWIYNVWWKRWDQLTVLMHSRFTWPQRLQILTRNLMFYLTHNVRRLLRFPGWVVRRISA